MKKKIEIMLSLENNTITNTILTQCSGVTAMYCDWECMKQACKQWMVGRAKSNGYIV